MEPTTEKPKKIKWGRFILRSFLGILGIITLVIGFVIFAEVRNAYLPAYKVKSHYGKSFQYNPDTLEWKRIESGDSLRNFQRLRVSRHSQVDLSAGEKVLARVKGYSELEVQKPRINLWGWAASRLHIATGRVFIMVDGSQELQISVPHSLKIKKMSESYVQISQNLLVANLKQGVFLIEVKFAEKAATLTVLRGSASIKQGSFGKWLRLVYLTSHQKLKIRLSDTDTSPHRLEVEDWSHFEEAYYADFKPFKEPKRTRHPPHVPGNLQSKITEIGTVSEMGQGYMDFRIFRPLPKAGDKTSLKLEYEVIHDADAVGFYIKTKGLDLSQYETLEVSIEGVDTDHLPERFMIELKSGAKTVRNFLVRGYSKEPSKLTFPLRVKNPTELSEIVVHFRHTLVGPSKVGSIRFNSINLVPVSS